MMAGRGVKKTHCIIYGICKLHQVADVLADGLEITAREPSRQVANAPM